MRPADPIRATDFRTELTLFADSIFREDRSVVDLLRAKHTFLNERIALHYGITDVKGDRFRRVELAAVGALGAARQGRRADGGRLSRTARRRCCAARSSSSTFRACRRRTPPPNVPTLDEKDIGTTKALTMREMMAKHRSNPTCASCHAVMDPLGLALENFDATGMWRDRDRYAGVAIDSSRQAARRHARQRPRRSAQRAAAASRAVRADVHRGAADVRDRAHAGATATCPPCAGSCAARRPATTSFRRSSRPSFGANSSGCAGCLSRPRRRQPSGLRRQVVEGGITSNGDTKCIYRRSTSHGARC